MRKNPIEELGKAVFAITIVCAIPIAMIPLIVIVGIFATLWEIHPVIAIVYSVFVVYGIVKLVKYIIHKLDEEGFI